MDWKKVIIALGLMALIGVIIGVTKEPGYLWLLLLLMWLIM